MQIVELETFLRSFLRALDALTYNIRNIPCSANMRNFSRTANIGICNFPAFSQGQNAVIDSLRSISKTAYVVICISPSFSKAPHAASCQLLTVFVTFQEPQPKTSRPRDQQTSGPGDQRTRRPEDQGTRGPGDQRTRGPEDQATRGPGDQRTRGSGSMGPKDHGTSPNSRAQAEPTLEKKKLGPPYCPIPNQKKYIFARPGNSSARYKGKPHIRRPQGT